MPGKNPALKPAHMKGSAIMSYHQCHYHGDHMHSSRVNVGHMFICEPGGRGPTALVHGSHGQWHFWPEGETSVLPPRCHVTFLCGSDSEDAVSSGEEGKAGGKPALWGLRVWTLCKARDLL